MGAEVIEVVERRRRWSTEDKLKVLLDALEPGASIAAVARPVDREQGMDGLAAYVEQQLQADPFLCVG